MRLPDCPWPLRSLLSRLPQYPPAAALAVALNLCLGHVLNGANLPQATGKVVCIRVRDAGLRLLFRVHEKGVAACAGVQPDVTITADASTFVSLALRQDDADTLFFSRRLMMEGDTELGLLVKNTLDALDPGVLRFAAARFSGKRRSLIV
jgi:predicted lipid carrier protein YhbT